MAISRPPASSAVLVLVFLLARRRSLEQVAQLVAVVAQLLDDASLEEVRLHVSIGPAFGLALGIGVELDRIVDLERPCTSLHRLAGRVGLHPQLRADGEARSCRYRLATVAERILGGVV